MLEENILYMEAIKRLKLQNNRISTYSKPTYAQVASVLTREDTSVLHNSSTYSATLKSKPKSSLKLMQVICKTLIQILVITQ